MPSPSERPRVGVTLSRQSAERSRQNYLDALDKAGADAVALYPDDPTAPGQIERLDALVLSGGGDVNPALYGQNPHPTLTGVDDERDRFELDAINGAVSRRLPILAICRGHQVVNVALGGSLEQHIESGAHRTPEGFDPKTHSAWHEVRLADQGWLASVYRSSSITTNSRHHQGIREGMLAGGLVPVAWSDDGYIEGYEGEKDGARVVGVQWHPERVEADERGGFNDQSAELFTAFVSEVRRTSERVETARVAGARK
jgi:putative glutamine amidotransferase